jgi:hypothetical protein
MESDSARRTVAAPGVALAYRAKEQWWRAARPGVAVVERWGLAFRPLSGEVVCVLVRV